jgi:hypothetical protein
MGTTSKKAPAKTEIVVAPASGLATQSAYNWLKKKVDEDTGEEYDAPKYKYIPGNPRDYRTDMGADGSIKINGVKPVELPMTIQALAWKGFTCNLFDMGEKNWVELWFIDSQDCVSAMLFHGFSYEAFMELLAPLEYDELKLSDVLLTINLDKKRNAALKLDYHIASFTYTEATDKERTKELKAYAKEHQLYRKATIKEEGYTEHFNHRVYNPIEAAKKLEA